MNAVVSPYLVIEEVVGFLDWLCPCIVCGLPAQKTNFLIGEDLEPEKPLTAKTSVKYNDADHAC